LFVDGDQAPAARMALPRARLWWFTVPRAGGEDRVLQFRKLDVGRRALGNTGPRFLAADADRLLAERRLVLDLNGVPRLHCFVDYYATPRLVEIAAAMGRLSGMAPGVAESVAGVREVLGASGTAASDGGAGARRAEEGEPRAV